MSLPGTCAPWINWISEIRFVDSSVVQVTFCSEYKNVTTNWLWQPKAILHGPSSIKDTCAFFDLLTLRRFYMIPRTLKKTLYLYFWRLYVVLISNGTWSVDVIYLLLWQRHGRLCLSSASVYLYFGFNQLALLPCSESTCYLITNSG